MCDRKRGRERRREAERNRARCTDIDTDRHGQTGTVTRTQTTETQTQTRETATEKLCDSLGRARSTRVRHFQNSVVGAVRLGAETDTNDRDSTLRSYKKKITYGESVTGRGWTWSLRTQKKLHTETACASSIYFEGHRAKPLMGLDRRAPKGRPTWNPHVVSDQESLAAQRQGCPASRAVALGQVPPVRWATNSVVGPRTLSLPLGQVSPVPETSLRRHRNMALHCDLINATFEYWQERGLHFCLVYLGGVFNIRRAWSKTSAVHHLCFITRLSPLLCKSALHTAPSSNLQASSSQLPARGMPLCR